MSTIAARREHVRARGHISGWFWVIGGIVVLLALVYAALRLRGDEMLRRRVEYNANQRLKGYTIRIPRLHFNLIGCSLTLRDVEIIQQQHPQPPIAKVALMKTSVHWRALLHGRLVADFLFDRPQLRVNLPQVRTEAKDSTKLKQKGWQEAAEQIYPLKINSLEVRNGTVTYVDRDPKRPLRLEHLNIEAENIRNVWSAERVYPSTVHMDTVVFDNGRLRVDGQANFLSEPQASVDVDVDFSDVPLKDIDPAANHANLRVRNGILSAAGHVEYAPKIRRVELSKATIRQLDLDYQHAPQTEQAEAARLEHAEQTAKAISNEPSTLVNIEELRIQDGSVGYFNETVSPGYRLFLSNADVLVRRLTNQATPEPAEVRIDGRFMGSGHTQMTSRFRPVAKVPEFDMSLEINNTDLPALNDVFRAYGNFDVKEGKFSFFSELHAANGSVQGYIKPLFENMKVYDLEKDRDKPLFHQLYEVILGGVAALLENDRSQVATKAEVAGRIDNPNVRTWQAILNLLRNAFVQAIRPGLDAQLTKR